MNPRTKQSMINKLKKECEKLAKTRDNLRNLRYELEMQVEDSEEAIQLLEECIDKLSELN